MKIVPLGGSGPSALFLAPSCRPYQIINIYSALYVVRYNVCIYRPRTARSFDCHTIYSTVEATSSEACSRGLESYFPLCLRWCVFLFYYDWLIEPMGCPPKSLHGGIKRGKKSRSVAFSLYYHIDSPSSRRLMTHTELLFYIATNITPNKQYGQGQKSGAYCSPKSREYCAKLLLHTVGIRHFEARNLHFEQ